MNVTKTAQLESSLASSQAEEETLKSTVKSMTKDLALSKQNLADSNQAKSIIEKRVAELESELAAAQSASKSAAEAIALKETEHAMASEAAGATRKELESASRKNLILEQQISDFSVEMEKLSGVSEEALRCAKRAERAESVNRVLESELQSANTRYEDAVRNLSKARYKGFQTSLMNAEHKRKC